MQDNIMNRAAEYIKKHRRAKVWQNILVGLASIVVFCTTYALIIPAITMENGPTCGKTAHQHVEECYETETKTLICGLEEHVHDERLCYIDVTADVETEADWRKTLPKQLTGDWTYDINAAAKSQLGYSESYYNIEVDEDGSIHPYTRYGQWAGKPYDEWNHLFVGFCLYYGNAEESTVSWQADPNEWMISLKEKEQFAEFSPTYAPDAGEIAFLDTDGDGKADRTGVIEEYTAPVPKEKEEEEDVPGNLRLIEGDTAHYNVEYADYEVAVPNEDREEKSGSEESEEDETQILGYTKFPEPVFYCGIEEHIHTEACAVKEETVSEESGQALFTLTEEEAEEATTEAAEETTTEAAEEITTESAEETTTEAAEETTTEEAEETTTEAAEEATTEAAEETTTEEAEEATTEAAEETTTEAAEETTTEAAAEETAEEDIVHEEGSVSGKYIHSTKYEYYQYPYHNNTAGATPTYVLVPGDSEEGWEPNVLEWSAKKDANYLVVYCAECFIESSGGNIYDSYTMDNSRFGSLEIRRKLAGVIAHSYPYLTHEEMQQELKTAYENGEIAVDVSECSASEYTAAVQAAIWQLITPGINYSTYSYVKHTDQDENCINQIKEFGHTDSTLVQEHCETVTNWLMNQSIPEDLIIKQYDYTVEKDEYGLYTLNVNAEFNRPIISGEIVEMQMLAGKQMTDCRMLENGSDTFAVTMTGLTEKELLDAEISLNLNGKRMQAYYFEHSTKQDMIGGQWESYQEDLSFEVTSDSTEVSVTKHWTEEAPEGTKVLVQLYGDGEKVRESILLSSENNWTYTWKALPKTDVLGNAIEYTVRETPLEGYYSNIQRTDGAGQTVAVWEEADPSTGLEAGKQYMFLTNAGALMSEGTQALYWGKAVPEDVSACSDAVIWKAQESEDGKVFLYNKETEKALGLKSTLNDYGSRYSSIILTSKEEKRMSFEYKTVWNEDESEKKNCLSGTYGETDNLYFIYIRDSGIGNVSNYFERAADFTVYKMVEKEVPPAEINYYITNTKIKEEIALMEVSVTKEWTGRPDSVYPESAVVQLLQNGQEFDEPVTLSQENDWTAVWYGLPKTDNDGNVIEYTVEEAGVDGYSGSQTAAEKEDGGVAVTLTNSWNPEYADVILKKTDFSDQSLLLPGAQFTLYLATNNVGEPIPGAEEVSGILYKDQITVGEDGTVSLELPVNETFYLTETKAPDGYELYDEAAGFTVTKRESLVEITLLKESGMIETADGTAAVIEVKNRAGYELPKTGGTGEGLYRTGGMALMLLAGVLLFCCNKKQRREDG